MFQFSTYFPGYFNEQYWLWWVFLALGECDGASDVRHLDNAAVVALKLFDVLCLRLAGFMLFIRGFVNYSRVRKLADPAYATLPRTRVLFIY